MSSAIEPYQQRVVTELEELSLKLEKLKLFLASSSGKEIPQPELGRLMRQYHIMMLYQQVLAERIDAFTSGE